MIRYELTGRTALVTGAASGIGLATATLLASSGAKVAINFRLDDARGPDTVARLAAEGLPVSAAPGDVAVAGEAEAMVKAAIDHLGRLDLLVNNAGTPGGTAVIPPSRLDLITEELWSVLIETNLLGVFRCTKAAAEALRSCRGAVVSVASIAGLNSAGSSLAYGATKAGVVNLTKSFARALAPEVRVNAIAPGSVESSWPINWTNEQRSQSIDRALLKRRGTPEDMAEVIAFLGFGAAMVTGQTLTVDGGLTV